MYNDPDTEAFWLRGLLPQRRNPVPPPPVWGSWGGSFRTEATEGPTVYAKEMVTINPVGCSFAFVGGSGSSNDKRINRVGWGLTLQLCDGQAQHKLGRERLWCQAFSSFAMLESGDAVQAPTDEDTGQVHKDAMNDLGVWAATWTVAIDINEGRSHDSGSYGASRTRSSSYANLSKRDYC
eukprot:247847-Pyramimonas_sp.AAC.1